MRCTVFTLAMVAKAVAVLPNPTGKHRLYDLRPFGLPPSPSLGQGALAAASLEYQQVDQLAYPPTHSLARSYQIDALEPLLIA